jgi:hypothetical protein
MPLDDRIGVVALERIEKVLMWFSRIADDAPESDGIEGEKTLLQEDGGTQCGHLRFFFASPEAVKMGDTVLFNMGAFWCAAAIF